MWKKIIGIVENSKKDYNYAASTIFGLSDYECLLIQDLKVDNILNLINEHEISALMIDYNINFDMENKKGASLFNQIKQRVEAFPIVILTALPNEVRNTFEIDADKIYEKSKFFKSEEDYASEKVNHMLDNIKQFQHNLDEKESIVYAMIKKGRNMNINDYNKLIQLQDELSKYNIQIDPIPQELKKLDSFEKANELIKSIEELMKKL